MRTDPSIPPPILPARLLTVPDVCALVQAKQWFVHAEVKRGRLRALKVGGLVRFDPSDVARWIEGDVAEGAS